MNTHVRDNLNYLYNPPSVDAYNSAAISVANITWTALTFDSERWDPAGFHSTSVNTGRCTVPSGYAGEFDIGATGYFAAAAGGTVIGMRILVNGNVVEARYYPTLGAGYPSTIGFQRPWRLSVNDYVEIQVYHDQGAARNFSGAEVWVQWRGG
jgi:hypothetical protein